MGMAKKSMKTATNSIAHVKYIIYVFLAGYPSRDIQAYKK